MKKTLGTVVAVVIASFLIGIFTVEAYAAAGEIGKDGRFIAYDNGTVLDTKTKLMWAAKDNGSDIKWEDAKKYCEDYRGGGYTDWRMPTHEELAGLYDVSIKGKNSNSLTDLIELTSCCPWASDTKDGEAAYFSFLDGGLSWYPKVLEPFGFRAYPVRSGK